MAGWKWLGVHIKTNDYFQLVYAWRQCTAVSWRSICCLAATFPSDMAMTVYPRRPLTEDAAATKTGRALWNTRFTCNKSILMAMNTTAKSVLRSLVGSDRYAPESLMWISCWHTSLQGVSHWASLRLGSGSGGGRKDHFSRSHVPKNQDSPHSRVG